jgi:hypothetical protein
MRAVGRQSSPPVTSAESCSSVHVIACVSASEVHLHQARAATAERFDDVEAEVDVDTA